MGGGDWGKKCTKSRFRVTSDTFNVEKCTARRRVRKRRSVKRKKTIKGEEKALKFDLDSKAFKFMKCERFVLLERLCNCTLEWAIACHVPYDACLRLFAQKKFQKPRISKAQTFITAHMIRLPFHNSNCYLNRTKKPWMALRFSTDWILHFSCSFSFPLLIFDSIVLCLFIDEH